MIGVESNAGPRLRLITRSIEGVDAAPRYVRVSVPEAGMLIPGRSARCFAVLAPPAGPMAPGAYDFARRGYFERLGATGFDYGRCRPAAFGTPPSWLDQQRLKLAALRWDLSETIQTAPGRGCAIAAALITGYRSATDIETNEALTNSGLGHLLSVSGIHMGVVGGLVFGALVWLFALIPPIALRWPVKKLAAIDALTSLAIYLVISGSSVPALRAFVMACFAFGAMLLDRPAISFPEPVLEPGFQMSFAATMALVALSEMWKRRAHEPALPMPGPLIGALQWSARSIGGVILTSLVAGLATDHSQSIISSVFRRMLGLAPAQLERIAAPESCGEGGCELGGDTVVACTAERVAVSCGVAAIIIASTADQSACRGSGYIDATNRSELGRHLIYPTPSGYRIERAWPAHIQGAWTPALSAGETAQE